jgi:hypothetical protein
MHSSTSIRVTFATLVAGFCAQSAVIAGAPAACAARLEVVPLRIEISTPLEHWVDSKELRITIRNVGSQPLLLVQPGDGSGDALRTPIVTWSVRDASGPVVQKLTRYDSGINHLEPGDVFRLQPGESRALSEWISPIVFASPGKLQITLHYVNDPNLQWTGHPFGKHDPTTMRLVQQSTPCNLVSDPVDIVVGSQIPPAPHANAAIPATK